MKNLIVDQCQLESAPPIPIKSTFKVDHGATVDALADGSPEESSSECSDSLVNKNPIGSELQTSSATTGSEQSRPSSEVEVEVVAASAEEGSTASRVAIRPSGRNHHQTHRSAKRKYEDLSSSVSASDASGIAVMEQQQNTTENSSSSESASIQHHQQSELDQQAELDAARWKRLYAGAIDADGLQVKKLFVSSTKFYLIKLNMIVFYSL